MDGNGHSPRNGFRIEIRNTIIESDKSTQSHIRNHLCFVCLAFCGHGKNIRPPNRNLSAFSVYSSSDQNNHPTGNTVHYRFDFHCFDYAAFRQGLLLIPVSAWNTSGFADLRITADRPEIQTLLFQTIQRPALYDSGFNGCGDIRRVYVIYQPA